MNDSDPIREYIEIEAWEYETGDVAWRIRSLVNEELNLDSLHRIAFELGESLLDPKKENPVIFSLHLQEYGSNLVRYYDDQTFITHSHYVWLKKMIHEAEWKMRGHDARPLLLNIVWSLSWLWHKLFGHLAEPRKSALASPCVGSPTVTEMLSEQSEAVENAHNTLLQGGKVLPFRRS